jgi:hypothetical protein
MLTESSMMKRENDIERNRAYISTLIKILYFIVSQHWAHDSFQPMLDFIAGLGPLLYLST